MISNAVYLYTNTGNILPDTVSGKTLSSTRMPRRTYSIKIYVAVLATIALLSKCLFLTIPAFLATWSSRNVNSKCFGLPYPGWMDEAAIVRQTGLQLKSSLFFSLSMVCLTKYLKKSFQYWFQMKFSFIEYVCLCLTKLKNYHHK